MKITNLSLIIIILSSFILVVPNTSSIEAQNTVHITLYANNFGYNATKGGPDITAVVGDLVVIHLIGNGSSPARHDWVLDEDSPSPYNVSTERLRNGETETIEFLANRPGAFQYYCSVAPPIGQSHRDRGQWGMIRIMDSSSSTNEESADGRMVETITNSNDEVTSQINYSKDTINSDKKSASNEKQFELLTPDVAIIIGGFVVVISVIIFLVLSKRKR